MGIFDVVSARLSDGEVFDSAKLKNTIRFLIENDMRNIVIDLGNLEYIYSDTINAFIASNRQMLEVSGRIAILSEHPKVQDILKRAGLDNIMRIYRSEAEMVADSKEILRQTSSYRIEELQKISNQDFPAVPQEPKSEFDDFRDEMGEQLGTKIENNEYPNYQYGAQPASPPPQQNFSSPPQPAPEPPAYSQPPMGGNFDYPTVQLPIGQYGDMARGDAGMESDDEDSRQRRSPNDRLRSPNARKGQGRRVGGRENVPDTQPLIYQEEAYSQSGGPSEPPAPVFSDQPYSSAGYAGASQMPTGRQPVLVEEKSFPWKGLLFILVFLAAGGGLVYYINQSVGELPKPRIATESPVPTPAVEPVPPTVAAQPEKVPDLSAQTEKAPPAPPAPAPRVEQVKPRPAPKPAPTPRPAPTQETRVSRLEKPAPAPKPTPAPRVTTPAPAAPRAGNIRITSEPPGAEVLVNFSKKGETPLDVDLINNSNKIIVRMPGFEKFETTISKNTSENELNVKLEREGDVATPEVVQPPRQVTPPSPPQPPAPPPPPPPPPVAVQKPTPKAPEPKPPAPEPTVVRRPDPPAPAPVVPFTPGSGPPGEIFLSSSPARADIIVNGRNTGKKTPAKLELPSGAHQIRMVKDGQVASVEHKVNEGKNRALHLSLQ